LTARPNLEAMKLLRTAGALLLAGLAAACTASPEPTATPTPAPDPRPVVTGGLGSDGLTVRYQDRDGSIKTLRVEDFRR